MRGRQTKSPVAVVLIAMLLAIPVGAGATPGRNTPVAAANANLILTLQISSSLTDEAVERAGGEIRELKVRLQASDREKRRALRRAGISDQHKAQLQAELASVQSQIQELIDDLAAKDVAYAASLNVYKEGLTGLLAQDDPRVAAAMQRYGDGDLNALDQLQEVIRLIRAAREAGVMAHVSTMRLRSAQEQRAVASLFQNAAGSNRKPTAVVLAAWEEAARIEPENVEQWVAIAKLQYQLDSVVGVRDALRQAWRYAEDDVRRADVYLLYAALREADAPDLKAGERPLQAALALLQKRTTTEAQDPTLQARALSALNVLVSREMSEAEARTVQGEAVSPESLASGEAAWATGALIAAQLKTSYPNNELVLNLLWQHARSGAKLALAKGDVDTATTRLTEAVAIARSRLAEAPEDSDRLADDADALEDVSALAQLRNDYPAAKAALLERAQIRDRLSVADPQNGLTAHGAWSAYTGLGFLALSRADPGTAVEAFSEAVRIGRPFEQSNQDYLVSLGLSRLADAALAQGRFDIARRSLRELVARRSSRTTSENPPEFDAFFANLGLGDLKFLEGDYSGALRIYDLALSRAPVATGREDATLDVPFPRTAASFRRIEVMLAQGRDKDAEFAARVLLAELDQHASQAPGRFDPHIRAYFLAKLLAGMGSMGSSWDDLLGRLRRVEAFPGLTSTQQSVVSLEIDLVSRMASVEAAKGLFGQEARLATYRFELERIRALRHEMPRDPFLEQSEGAWLASLATASGARADWQAAITFYRDLAARGRIGRSTELQQALNYVLAREAVDTKSARHATLP